jgi:penicillin-binding protein 1C
MSQRIRLLLAAIGLALALPAAAQLPSFEQVRAAYRPSDAILLDRNGVPLSDLRFDPRVRRLDWVPLSQFSPSLREALIVSEDKRFFEHEGVDWKAFVGALWHNLFHSTKRGGSTLTMQLAGLLDPALAIPNQPGGRRSLEQKWDQGRAAEELEEHWSKQQILEAYLNLAPFRGDLQGVHAASGVLFGKRPSELDRAEALLVTAILPSPNAKADRIARRACARARVLKAGALCGRIEQLADKLDTPRNRPRYTLAPQLARHLLRQGGERITTTLDAATQGAAQEALRETLAAAPGRAQMAGALVMNNADASLRAWVGGTTPIDPDALQLRSAWRDAALPFAAALAIERKLASAASLLPISGNAPDGWRSVRTSVQSSDPTSSAVLLSTAGDGLAERMQALGLDARSDAMPNVEANLPQLAQAIRSLATGGQFAATHVLAESTPPRRSWRADAAFIATDVLADAEARATLFAEALPQNAGWQALWALNAIDEGSAAIIAVGEHQTFAVVIAGNASGKDSPAHIAAHALRNMMTRLAPATSQPPRLPAGLVRSLVSFEPPVEPPRREWFLRGTELVQSQPPGTTAHAAPAILHPLASEGFVELGDGESLVLEANLAARGAHWRANGQDLGEGLRRSWRPDPGHYRLELRGPNGELWDSREFDLSLKAQDDS